MHCQDHPSFLAFGGGSRPGRLSISPRDFCRFGLLYAQGGRWGGRQLLNSNFVQLAVSAPLPLSLPRTRAVRAEMIPGQRSLGSNRIPDDQTDHLGCYSWLWWVNGVRSSGLRLWPDAPPRTFAALGHEHGKRGMAVVPEWDLVFSWNDSTLDSRPWKDMNSDPHPLNRVFKLLMESQRPPGTKKDP